jgi:hypothetical protein
MEDSNSCATELLPEIGDHYMVKRCDNTWRMTSLNIN